MLNTRFAYLYSFMYIYAKRVSVYRGVAQASPHNPFGLNHCVQKKRATRYTKHGENAFIFYTKLRKKRNHD